MGAVTLKRAVLCVGLLLVSAGIAVAADKTVYVIDQITITLRAGQGTQHQILRTLPSGSPLQILSMNEETGYTHVRTKDGVEGWVLSQYLIDEPTSKIKLTAAEQKLARFDAEKKELEARIEALTTERDALDQEKKALAEERDRLLASGPAPGATGSAAPAEVPASLPPEKEAEMLRQENQMLKERSKKDWFIAGGVVAIGGVLFGLILSRLRVRRSGWGGNTL
jgi:SH3 domain protein